MLLSIDLLNINGDWGLGIGDWAQSPIPIKFAHFYYLLYLINYN